MTLPTLSKRNGIFLSLLIISLIITFMVRQHLTPPPPFQGYVEGEFVRVSAPFAGFLTSLTVARGTTVQEKTPLFILEQENEILKKKEAAGKLENSKEILENLKKGKRPEEVGAIKAQIAQAEADLDYAKVFLKRQKTLVETKATSPDNLDKAKSQYDRVQARILELNDQLKLSLLPSGREDEVQAAEKNVVAAQAVLEQASWQLNQKTIDSQVSGLVTETLYNPGDWVPSGSPVVTILPPKNIKIRFFVPETVLGKLQAGQSVKLSCSGCQSPIEGKITYISPKAEFTPPVIFSREWRDKLLYMIEAKPDVSIADKFHPGQPIDVEVSF